MTEIKTAITMLEEGTTHLCKVDEYLITDDHTIADIFRWLIDQGALDDLMYMVEQEAKNHNETGERMIQ